jgi:hypothetical protein
MAFIYKNTPKVIAQHEGVQAEIWERTFEIAVRAEELLKQHRAEGIASIDMAKGNIDAYVVLEDKNATNKGTGANSALSIEYGRNAYQVVVVDDAGKAVTTYEVGAMEGLHILEEASHLPKRGGPKASVPKVVKVKAKKKRGGGRG